MTLRGLPRSVAPSRYGIPKRVASVRQPRPGFPCLIWVVFYSDTLY